MRRTLPLLFAAWLLGAQSKPSDPPGKPKPTGAIHGVVKNEATGAPVTDYTIRAWWPLVVEGDPSRSFSGGGFATTDDDGRYSFASVLPGAVHMSAGKGQVVTIYRTVQVADGQDLAVDFTIPASPTISGRVLDENDQPLVDAFVWMIQSQYVSGALRRAHIGPKITAEDGSFTFDDGLEAGRAYYLLVDRDVPAEIVDGEPKPLEQREPLQAPTYYRDATSLEAATPLVLRPGEHREQVDLKIHKAATYCVDGKLERAGGAISEGFAIREQALIGTNLARLRSYSAKDGTFRACGLTPGPHALSPSNADNPSVEFAVANTDVHNVLLSVDTAKLHVELSWDGDPPAAPKAGPPALAPATVDVASMSPEAAKGYELARKAQRVMAGPVGNEVVVNLTPAGAMGSTSIIEPAPYDGPWGNDLTAGDYSLGVQVARGAYVKEVSYGGVAITDGMLHLAPGTNGTLRVVAAQGAVTLSCQVSDSDDNAVSDATVVLIPQSATTAALLAMLAKNAQTDAAGKVTLDSLAPGKYRVLALTHPYRRIPEDLDKLLLVKAQEVEIGEKAPAQVKVPVMAIE